MKSDCNLSELPCFIVQSLSLYLNADNDWEKLFHVSELSKHPETISCYKKLSNPTEALLHDIGNRGRTAKDLLILLDKSKLEKAQLILRRKFQSVKIVDQSPPNVTIERGSQFRLFCKAEGFPYPKFQWFRDGSLIESAKNSVLEIEPYDGPTVATFHCIVRNAIEYNREWSDFYCRNDKCHKSEATSHFITVTVGQTLKDSSKAISSCDNCAAAQRVMERIKSVIDDDEISAPCSCQRGHKSVDDQDSGDVDDDCCIATDKVALIVSNSEYWYLPKLSTPACDGQALAEALLTCGFKTITLADLTLDEMRVIVAEYCRLLGSGVYALFYFVGHGFEMNGQCYLLPVDAPNQNYSCDDCFCAEKVLEMMQKTDPSLNVILLDVCRKPPIMNTINMARNEVFKPKVNRNTVFGYATSFGEGAYEIRGDTNGIFMKYFKNYIDLRKPVTEILSLVMRDLEIDPKATDVQFPELRTNLTRPRSLADPLNPTGHTTTFDNRTLSWQTIHELPDPVKRRFNSLNLSVTIWFDFCGHFTNMVYVFTSVSSVCNEENEAETLQDEIAKQYLAYLKFPEGVEAVQPTVCDDMEEGVSVRTLVKHLQRLNGPLVCTLELEHKNVSKIVAQEIVDLGDVLIAKLEQWQKKINSNPSVE